MANQTNIDSGTRFVEAISSGQLDTLNALVSPSVVDHDPAPTQAPGAQGYIDFFTELRTAFPDLKIAVDTLVADDENVASAYTITGTHQGSFQGVAATGTRISARGMQIARYEDGMMVERWGSSDQLGIMQQLDAVPAETR